MYSLSGRSAHLILEILAYFIGARVYFAAAARTRTAASPAAVDRLFLLGAAILGAALGSKLLHLAEHAPTIIAAHDLDLWLGGKSLLGGLIGGTVAVELAKRVVGVAGSTGDPWVPALALGICIGRIGCQLSGTWDQTYGTPTSLPWGWNYGDDVMRHPVALYEIVLVALSGRLIWTRAALARAAGARFAAFLFAYCAIRFILEFLKPPFGSAAPGTLPVALYAGLTAIQWASVAGMAGYAALLYHRIRSTSGATRQHLADG